MRVGPALRRGTTLVELVIALALTGMLLAAASAGMLRQQRGFRWVGELGGAEAQMRPLAQMLPSELALLEPAAGDLAPGQASDSTLQVRATVASSFACDSSAGTVLVAPQDASGVAVVAPALSTVAGDSLWFFSGDSLGWQGRRVAGATSASAACGSPVAASGATVRLSLSAPMNAPAGTPLRITRQERFVIYRAADGAWYLGLSDWSAASARFASPQPVAGPFVRTRTGFTTSFRYFDASGAPITPNGSNEASIARVRVSSVSAGSGPASATGQGRRDSVDVAMSGRGAP